MPIAPVLQGVDVLVVEDDPDLRRLTDIVLRRAAATVTLAASVGEALEHLASRRPGVVISDISLPDEDGLVLIRKIRAMPEESGGQVPALAMTGHTERSVVREALAAGYQAFLAKPASPQSLVRAVAVLAGLGSGAVTA